MLDKLLGGVPVDETESTVSWEFAQSPQAETWKDAPPTLDVSPVSFAHHTAST